MRRYFLQVSDALGRFDDQDGPEFPNLQAALDEAHRSAREYLADEPQPGSLRFEIANETGLVVAMVPIHRTAGLGAERSR